VAGVVDKAAEMPSEVRMITGVGLTNSRFAPECAAAWILSPDGPGRAEGRSAWSERHEPVFGGI
jgi:hypothetical protein